MEPLGIQDMRFAKAEYIRALKDLRAADAEYVRAQAAMEQANARYRDAETAYQNALTENQKLLNEYQELLNQARSDSNEVSRAMYEAMIEALELSMEEARAQHAITMVNLEKDMAVAQYNLNKTLRDIAMAAKDLTPMEKKALASAAALYLALSEQCKDQIIDVAQKQYTLDSLVAIKNTKTDKEWDGDAYVAKVDYWKAKIAELEDEIAGYEEAKKNAPQVADLDAWSAELKKYEDAKAQLEYSRAQITKDSATFMVSIHEGFNAYKSAFENYRTSNGLKASQLVKDADGNYYYPAPTPVEDPEGAMEYTTVYDITIDDVDIPAGTTIGAGAQGAVTEMPKLDADKLSPAAKAKLASLLSSYNPAQKYDGTGAFATVINSDFEIDADADMKEFVIGDTAGVINSQVLYRYNDATGEVEKVAKADYGLMGAYTVLNREYVLGEKTLVDYDAKIAEAKAAWKADRDTLSWVYDAYNALAASKKAEFGVAKDSNYMKAYPPYLDSLKKYNAAHKAVTDAVADSNKVASAMVTATQEFIKAFNDVTNSGSWSTIDSTQFIDAVAKFAKAREEYLTKANGLDETTAMFTTKDENPLYLHYAISKDPAKVDSIKFSELNIYKLREKETIGGVEGCKYSWTLPAASTANTSIFGFIVDHLFNSSIKTHLTGGTLITDETDINGGYSFYDQFEYVPKAGNVAAHFTKGGSAMPEVAEDERTAEETAKGNIQDARDNFVKVYERYWGLSSFPTAIADAYDPTCYTDTTFVEPFPVVMFDGANVMPNKDVLAILGSVDPVEPKAADGSNFVDDPTNPTKVANSAIFGNNDTDFYTYMYWLSKKGSVDAQDLAVIKEWIDAVEERFDTFELENVLAAALAYQADLAVYNEENAAFDKKNTAWRNLMGTKVNADGDTVLYGVLVQEIVPGSNFSVKSKNEWNTDSRVVINATTGKWSNLKGKQLEFAEKYFPEYPKNLNDWYTRNWKVNDEIKHNQIILDAMKPAYLAAAKAAEYQKYVDAEGNQQTMNTGSWDELIASYEAARKKYVDDLDALIKAIKEGTGDGTIAGYKKLIADFAMFSDPTVSPDGTEMPYVMMQIAEAQLELESATQKLGAMQQALAYAKANLDRILEYVKSETDASVLLPFLYEIESNEEESISQLSQYGIIINLQSLIDEWFSFESYDEPVDPDFED